MTEDTLDMYLANMDKHGEWGDGVMLSAAVRLYERPIFIMTPEGQLQTVDTCVASSAEPIRLGLINNCHYVRIYRLQPLQDRMLTLESEQKEAEQAAEIETESQVSTVIITYLLATNHHQSIYACNSAICSVSIDGKP